MPKQTSFSASKELFRLVREVADKLDTAVAERLSDADIGEFVGFESARTSRWKHGQIAVQDAARLLSLSQSLDIDLTVLAHVAAGYLDTDEAIEILSSPSQLIRFLGEQMVLPADNQELSLIADDTRAKIIRRSPQHYRRRAKQIGREGVEEQESGATVLLVDSNKTTIRYFNHHTGPESGINGVVVQSGPEALIAAGRLQPQVVIFDLFIGQTDGFAAIKSLVDSEATCEAEVYATSLTITPDIVRSALGVGAREVLQRPLISKALDDLFDKTRTRR